MTRPTAVLLASLLLLVATGCSNTNKVPDGFTADRTTSDRSAAERAVLDRSGQERSSQDRASRDLALADAPPYACPPSVPSGSCSAATYPHSCWYGADPRWFCRTSAVCDAAAGTWKVVTPLDGCQSAPAATCPATSGVPYAGCAVDAGVKPVCVYSDRYCSCGFTGGPQPGWKCISVPAGCPVVPPDEGDPCTAVTGFCDYYPCSQRAECQSGHWHWQSVEC
jgi:hypothetical protein